MYTPFLTHATPRPPSTHLEVRSDVPTYAIIHGHRCVWTMECRKEERLVGWRERWVGSGERKKNEFIARGNVSS